MRSQLNVKLELLDTFSMTGLLRLLSSVKIFLNSKLYILALLLGKKNIDPTNKKVGRLLIHEINIDPVM